MERIQKGDKKVYPIIFPVQYGQLKSVNCFLYDNGESLTLIDAGLQTSEQKEFFLAALKKLHLTIQDIDQILLTHHHEDHVGLVNDILKEKEMPVYAHRLAVPRLHFEETFLHNRIEFFTTLYEEHGCLQIAQPRMERLQRTLENREDRKIQAAIHPLVEGDSVLGLKVIEAPGHSLDSVIFYDEETTWQFVGDLILEKLPTNAIVDFDDDLKLLPTVSQYEQSLLKCKALETEWIFPGHQAIFQQHTLEIEQKLGRIKRKEQRLLDTITKGYNTTEQIARQLYGEKLEKQLSLILSEVIGYLRYAEDRGKLKKTMKDGQWYFKLTP